MNTSIVSPHEPLAAKSPSYWAGLSKGKSGKAFRTVSSSGYRESAGNKSGLSKRTGNLKDISDVQEMNKLLN